MLTTTITKITATSSLILLPRWFVRRGDNDAGRPCPARHSDVEGEGYERRGYVGHLQHTQPDMRQYVARCVPKPLHSPIAS